MSEEQNISKESYWFGIVKEWEKSGKSQRSYAQDKALRLPQFIYWIRRYRQSKPSLSLTFIPVESSDASITKKHQDERIIRIELPHGIVLTVPA